MPNDAREEIRRQIFGMSNADQFWLASVIAENLGYGVIKEAERLAMQEKAWMYEELAK